MENKSKYIGSRVTLFAGIKEHGTIEGETENGICWIVNPDDPRVTLKEWPKLQCELDEENNTYVKMILLNRTTILCGSDKYSSDIRTPFGVISVKGSTKEEAENNAAELVKRWNMHEDLTQIVLELKIECEAAQKDFYSIDTQVRIERAEELLEKTK